MYALHLPTAFLIAGVLYLILPLTVWQLLRKQGVASNTLWCLGGLTFGLSLMLLGLRDQLPEALTYTLAIWLLLLGPLLRSAALRMELHRPVRLIWVLLGSVFFMAVYVFFHAVLKNADLRFLSTACVASAAFMWSAWLARAIHLRDRSISAQWIFVLYMAVGVLLALRVLEVVFFNGTPTALTQDPVSVFLIFWVLTSAIVSNVGFLGMFIERMNREALESAKMQARQDEMVRLSDQISQLDRRRSVGEIAASLAHELSQPLTNIYLISDRMDMELKNRNDPSLDKYFSDLNRNAQIAGDILGRIRSFIRSKDIALERIEIAQAISDVSALIHDLSYNESVDVQVSLPPQTLAVQADSVQLSQIFLNVIRNAIQATQGQALRQLHIQVWRDGNTAHISFTDNGPGLPPETRDQVGSAFFTTKPDGLGVGFSISKSIAQIHGGNLSIGNSPSGGAVVHLQLPALD